MWNFYFSMPLEIIPHLAVPTLSPYLISNIKYQDHDSVTHLIALYDVPCPHFSNSCCCCSSWFVSFPIYIQFLVACLLGCTFWLPISQWSSSEYKCWIGRSMCEFGVRSLMVWTPLILGGGGEFWIVIFSEGWAFLKF